MASEVLNINDINIPSNTGLFKVTYKVTTSEFNSVCKM